MLSDPEDCWTFLSEKNEMLAMCRQEVPSDEWKTKIAAKMIQAEVDYTKVDIFDKCPAQEL